MQSNKIICIKKQEEGNYMKIIHFCSYIFIIIINFFMELYSLTYLNSPFCTIKKSNKPKINLRFILLKAKQ